MEPTSPTATGLRRIGWLVVGLVCVGLGAVGIVVPGLPTTVFFIAAATCFTRSSPRLERWVLGLPRIGPMVRDHRAGLGMPRRAKAIAVGVLVAFAALGVVLAGSWVVRAVIAGAAAVGVAVILRQPTRERVLEAAGERAGGAG